MKTGIALVVTSLALVFSAQAAETSTQISNVHLCCKGCTGRAEKAIQQVDGVKASIDQDANTIQITGRDRGSVQKAADALAAGGFFGQSDNQKIKMKARTGAKGKNVQSVKIEGVHLCCGACVSAVEDAVKQVKGVQGHTAAKNAESFEVSGNFNDKEVLEAIQKAGLNGRVVK